MANFEKLLEFCSHYSHILVYGVGQYTWMTMPYLMSRGVRPEACLVSGMPTASHFMNEIKEYSVVDFSVEPGEKYGIILSLQEVHHEDVKNNIRKYFGEYADIFSLTSADVEYMGQIFRTGRMFELLDKKNEIDAKKKKLYQEKEERVLSAGKRVFLRFIDMRNIGCTVSWVYWFWQRKINHDDGMFWLFWPAATPAHANMELVGANKYLLEKMKGEDIEVISEDSLDFWQYMYVKHKDFFVIDNGFTVSDWTKRLNSFMYTHSNKVSGKCLSFTEKEEDIGRLEAGKMGVKGKYICFFIRDNLYVKKVMKFNTDVNDRVCRYRNCSIEEYRPVAEKLREKGLQLIRMGAMAEDKIVWENSIDYASNYHTEFMDAWLFANCEFFVGVLSGIQAIPQLFSKPMAMFNMPIHSTRNDYDMFTSADKDLGITMKYRLKDESRFLSLREMLEIETDDRFHPMATVGTIKTYDSMGVEIVKNTAQEVIDMTEEMIGRLDGSYEYTEDDKYLQKEYRKIVDSYPMKHNFPFIYRMSAKFLRDNQWLLE